MLYLLKADHPETIELLSLYLATSQQLEQVIDMITQLVRRFVGCQVLPCRLQSSQL
jgi:hypothetical protein